MRYCCFVILECWGDCLKRGAWTVCRFKGGGGGLARKRGVVFLRGVDTPMHTMDQVLLDDLTKASMVISLHAKKLTFYIKYF